MKTENRYREAFVSLFPSSPMKNRKHFLLEKTQNQTQLYYNIEKTEETIIKKHLSLSIICLLSCLILSYMSSIIAMHSDIIEKQAEDPLPSGGGMNAVPTAIET